MPSVPESGNNSVVDSKTRPNNLKIPEAAKYTDVTRTSSASFKPPMSKDPVLKKKTDAPQADSTWFTPLFYIKNMFGGNKSSESSSQGQKNEKNKKAPPVRNTSNITTGKVTEFKEAVVDHTMIPDEPQVPSFIPETATAATIKTDHSPRFSFTADEATGKRNLDKRVNKKVEPEEDVDPNAPKYNPLRFVENKSTYLHTPDKKGTTSFRITTSSKVKSKPNPVTNSPKFGNASKRTRRSPVTSRHSSASPKKIPHSDNTSNTNFPTRLRSKSTPDHSSIKARLVSDPTCPKSLSLKSTSSKNALQYQNDVNENRAEVADVKPSSRQSFPMKPTILDGMSFQKNSNKKTPGQTSKSSLQIGVTYSPNGMQLTRSTSALMQSKQVSDPNRSEKGHIKPSKSNIQRPAKYGTSTKHNKEQSSETRHANLDKTSTGTKVSPLVGSPTLLKPSVESKQTQINRTKLKENDPVTKFANAQQRAKDKIKNRMDTDENKMKAHQMVLPASVENSSCFASKSGLVVNSENNSPMLKSMQRKGKQSSVKDLSPTIAESPIRRPTPPGVMCLTGRNPVEKKSKAFKEERKIVIEEVELPPSLLPSFTDPPRSPLNADIETPTFSTFTTNRSISPSTAIPPECCGKGNNISSEFGRSYMDPRGDDDDDEDDDEQNSLRVFHTGCSERRSVQENIYHVSNEYTDMSNSACCSDECCVEGHDNISDYEMDVFSDDAEHDTCNSALSRKSITNKKACMHPSCLVSDIGDSEVFESPCGGPTVIIQRNEDDDFVPFETEFEKEPIYFFSDEKSPVRTPTTMTAVPNAGGAPVYPIDKDASKDNGQKAGATSRRYHSQQTYQRDTENDSTKVYKESPTRNSTPMSVVVKGKSPYAVHVSKDSGRENGKNGKRRRYPFDIDRTKVEANESGSFVVGPPRTPILKRPPPTATSSQSGTRLHPSPYLRLHDESEKQSSGSNYLGSLNRKRMSSEDHHASINENTKAVAVGTASPHRSQYKRSSPEVIFSGIASSFGDAFNSFADTIKKSFPAKAKKEDSSPTKLKPTEVSDKPLSSTMTYISSSLEEKGLSPLPWIRSGKKNEKKGELTDEKKDYPKNLSSGLDRPLKYRLSSSSPESTTIKRSNKHKQTKPQTKSTDNSNQSVPDATKIPKAKDVAVEKEPDPKPVLRNDADGKISLAPVTDGFKKTIEDTKKYLSTVFSPPVKKIQPDLTKEAAAIATMKSNPLPKVNTNHTPTTGPPPAMNKVRKNPDIVSSQPPKTSKTGMPTAHDSFKSPSKSERTQSSPTNLTNTPKKTPSQAPVSITAHSLTQTPKSPTVLKLTPRLSTPTHAPPPPVNAKGTTNHQAKKPPVVEDPSPMITETLPEKTTVPSNQKSDITRYVSYLTESGELP